MRILLTTSLLALLSGCCWNQHPYPAEGHARNGIYASQSIVNNSGYTLDVFQDGQLIKRDLGVGQVLPLRPILFRHYTAVTVTGHTSSGDHIGTSSYTFDGGLTESWTVDRLNLPKPPR